MKRKRMDHPMSAYDKKRMNRLEKGGEMPTDPREKKEKKQWKPLAKGGRAGYKMGRVVSRLKKYFTKKGHFDKNPGGGKDARKFNIGGRANLLEEMGRIDARRHPDAADRAEKRRVIGELNKGYKSGGAVLKGKKVGCQIK
jgi:hypothetical protein